MLGISRPDADDVDVSHAFSSSFLVVSGAVNPSPQVPRAKLAAANFVNVCQPWLLLSRFANHGIFDTLFSAMLIEKRIDRDRVFWTTLAYRRRTCASSGTPTNFHVS